MCVSLLGGEVQTAGLTSPEIFYQWAAHPPQLPPQAAPIWRSPTMTSETQASGHSCITCCVREPPWWSSANCRSGITNSLSFMHFTASSVASTGSPQLLVQSGSGCPSMGAVQSRTKKFKICVSSFKHPTTSKPICSQFWKPHCQIFSLSLTQRTNSPS